MDLGLQFSLVPKALLIGLNLWVYTYMEFWLIGSKLEGVKFQLITLIYRRGDFVYHMWGGIIIYPPMSFEFLGEKST